MHRVAPVKRKHPRGRPGRRIGRGGPYNRRMIRTRALLAAVLLALAALPAAAQPIGVLLEGSYWRTGPTGQVQVVGTTGGAIGGAASTLSFDLEQDLHVGKKGVFPLGARVLRKSWRLEAEYLDTSWSSDAVLTREFVFQGVTYHASDAVSAAAKLRDISGSFRYEVPFSPYASAGVGVDADYLRTEATLAVPARGASATAADTRSFVLPTGTVAVNFHDSTRHIWVDLKAGYISYHGSRAEKGRAELGWAITENVGLRVGWRLLDVTYVKERDSAPEDRVKVRLDGYNAGLFLAF